MTSYLWLLWYPIFFTCGFDHCFVAFLNGEHQLHHTFCQQFSDENQPSRFAFVKTMEDKKKDQKG